MRRLVPGLVVAMAVAAATARAGAPPAAAAPEPAAPAPEPAASAPAASDEARSKAPVVSDGPVAVTTRLSPDPSNVGDLLVLEVVAAYPRDVRVNLPTRIDLAPLHHVRTEEGEAEATGDGLRKTFRIELQHFEVGPATIPSFPLTYVDAEGAVHTVQIPARAFTVESLLANETDPQRRGEDPPISREYPDTLAETIAWSAAATLLLALGAWLLLRRLRARDRSVPAPPPIPPHELAFEALDELERGELLAQGQLQRYYVELTEIAKGYLEGRFGVEALDRTTDEIRRALLTNADRLAPLSTVEVVEFLQRCDLVKFARFAPPTDEARGALSTVREMVQASMPTPEAIEPAAAEPRAAAEPDVAEPHAAAEPDSPPPSRTEAEP
jgi:hypothetical protein